MNKTKGSRTEMFTDDAHYFDCFVTQCEGSSNIEMKYL